MAEATSSYEAAAAPPDEPRSMARHWFALGTFILIVVVVLVLFAPQSVDLLLELRAWLTGRGAAGVAISVALFVPWIVLTVPSTTLELVMGAVWGFAGGGAVNVAGKCLGSSLAYVLGLSVLKELVDEKAARNWRVLAIKRKVQPI